MAQEVERKFLLSTLPSFLDGQSFKSIRQGYIAVEAGGNEVRVRAKGKEYWLTVKSSGTLHRTEVELPISKEDFVQLWSLTGKRQIEKHRYEIEQDGKMIEVDVFKGNLNGLILAEIEFETIEEATAFQPFTWLTKEVTQHQEFKNRNLANLDNYQSILTSL